MKRVKKIAVASILFYLLLSIFTGCQGVNEKTYTQVLNENSVLMEQIKEKENAPKKEELKIMAPNAGEYSDIQNRANEFMELHQDVNISIEAANMTVLQYYLHLATRMMSDTCPDIAITYDFLGKYAKSGLLQDIYELMDADPDFHKEEYYENLFKACETNGRLYELPANPYINVFFFNKRITDAVGQNFAENDTINYRQMLDIYDTAVRQGVIDPAKVEFWHASQLSKSIFTVWESPMFMDWRTRSASFDSPQFLEFLEITNTFRADVTVLNGGVSMSGGELSTPDRMNSYMMAAQSIYSPTLSLLDYTSETIVGPVRPTATDGKKEACADILTVHSACRNKELAWEFLKFCLDGGTPKEIYSFPVNRTRLKEQLASNNQQQYFPYVDEALSSSERIGETPWLLMEESANKIISQYYDSGLITAEECAQQLQEKVKIMMRE